jgi:hypothetical protein
MLAHTAFENKCTNNATVMDATADLAVTNICIYDNEISTNTYSIDFSVLHTAMFVTAMSVYKLTFVREEKVKCLKVVSAET